VVGERDAKAGRACASPGHLLSAGAHPPAGTRATSSGTRRSDDGPSARICSSSGVRRSSATHRTTGGSRSSRAHLVASSYRRSGPRGGSGHRRQVDPILAVTKASGTPWRATRSTTASHCKWWVRCWGTRTTARRSATPIADTALREAVNLTSGIIVRAGRGKAKKATTRSGLARSGPR